MPSTTPATMATAMATGTARAKGTLPWAEAQHGHGVGADGEEGHVAEVEQAGLADHHVEADGDEHEDGHRVDSTSTKSVPGVSMSGGESHRGSR